MMPARQSQHAPPPASSATVLVGAGELVRRRVLRALAARGRYRYVQPALEDTPLGWVITSPCCSRNIDPDGGVIDIARLQQADGHWLLYSRDHALDCWVLHSRSRTIDAPLRALCEDPQRVFWP